VSKPLTLVLLPGLDGTSILFRPFIQSLPDWIQPRCVEYGSAGPHDYAGLLPEVKAASAGLSNFVLLGWSFSGPLALMTAAESPPGLRGVVICASFVRAPVLPLRWLRRGAVAPLARMGPLLARMLMSIVGYASDDLRHDQAEIFRRVPPSAFAARARAALGVDARNVAARCRVPVLYLAASHDIVVPRWNATAVTSGMGHGEIVTIQGRISHSGRIRGQGRTPSFGLSESLGST